eukprot:gene6660-10211_t
MRKELVSVWYSGTSQLSEVAVGPLGARGEQSVLNEIDEAGFALVRGCQILRLTPDEKNEWLYCADLAPGDILFFDSHRVFHASLSAAPSNPHPSQNTERYSVDIRFTIVDS